MANNQNITELLKTLLEKPKRNKIQITVTKSNGEVLTFEGNDLIGTLFTDIDDNQIEITQIAIGNLTTIKAIHAAKIISETLQKTT